MNLASFFTGIGGFDLAFERAGIPAVLQCELDESCRKLLGKKFSALVLSDIRAVAAAHRRMQRNKPGPNYDEWNRIFELLRSAAVWCGGFPCQDLSIAGARSGLAGERSGLWYAFRRIIALFRPAWVVIENVPGLLSSNGGRDFALVLSGLEKLGYRWAYRVFDAQYAGLAQRRERVFVVASFGDYRCAEVLFERESVCWDSPPSRGPGQNSASTLTGSSGGISEKDRPEGRVIPELAPTLLSGANQTGGTRPPGSTVDNCESLIPETAWAVQARDEKGSDSNTKRGHLLPVLADPVIAKEGETYTHEGRGNFRLRNVVTAFTGKDHGGDATEELSPTLRAMPHKDSHANGGGQVAVAFSERTRQDSKAVEVMPNGISPALTNPGDGGRSDAIRVSYAGVRRLTPRECERLQGFPDDWTAGFADSVRYRMLGNAVAEPCALWIAQRIKAVAERSP